MTIQAELAAVVKKYSTFDKNTQRYTKNIDKNKLIALDRSFIIWIHNQLVQDGTDEKTLLRNYRRLSKYLHPDKKDNYIPELVWLEEQLSEGKNDGYCFKTLGNCFDVQKNPSNFKKFEFSEIYSVEDCKIWLGEVRQQTQSYSGKKLCDSLLELVNEFSKYSESSSSLNPKALKALVQLIPSIIATFGVTLIMEELFAVYILYFLLLKGGKKLSSHANKELKEAGQSVQHYAEISALTTTTMLIKIFEMIFWLSRGCLSTSLSIGAKLFSPLLSHHHTEKKADTDAISQELISAEELNNKGIKFSNPLFKVISLPFEKYLAVNKQQFFTQVRVGSSKRRMIQAFIFRLQVLDQLDNTLDDKLNEIVKELELIKAEKTVYEKKTKEAVDYVFKVIELVSTTMRAPQSDQLALEAVSI